MNKIAIVGTGAIGSLLAYQCERLRYEYQLLARTPTEARFTATDLQGKQHLITPIVSLISQPDTFDLLVLPIKAYQINKALDELQPHILSKHVIVLLHNGLGTLDTVRQQFPNNPLIVATTSYGALKDVHGDLQITGLGQTHLGWLHCPDKAKKTKIEQLLSAILPPSQWHHDIKLSLWKKVAINAAINPLTAINNIKNGALNDQQYQSTITHVCCEIAAVMQAEGYSTTPATLENLVKEVISATANNFSSMHQDIHHKRPTEIDFINGYVVTAAHKWGVETPINKALLGQIKNLEKTYNY